MKKLLFILLSVLTMLPFVLLFCFYDVVPEDIPTFVDLQGRPIAMMAKHPFSVIRLPLMGLLTQVVCLSMYRVRFAYGHVQNERLWLSVSFLAAIKMSLTSLEVLLYGNTELVHWLRISVIGVVGGAILSIAWYGYGLVQCLHQQGVYFPKIGLWQQIALGLSFIGYLLLVLVPLILT